MLLNARVKLIRNTNRLDFYFFNHTPTTLNQPSFSGTIKRSND